MPLASHFERLNARYKGAEGDAFALEELAPVAGRFTPAQGRVLEVGCGYGRNLVALSTLPGARVVGCDVARDELRLAAARAAALPADRGARIALVEQEARLPFRDDTFDLVVLWQVLEHVLGGDGKRGVVHECVRVLKSGGHLLVETPNQWFPFDYHDNKLPLVHWFLPERAREWLTWKVRGERYAPSQYLSLPGAARLVRSAPRVTRTRKATRVYFAPSYAEAWRDLAGTQVGLKRALFVLLWPVHAVLSLFGGSADVVMPSLRVVWQVEKA